MTFAVEKKYVDVAGFQLLQLNTLEPIERIWIQENYRARTIAFQKRKYTFVKELMGAIDLKSEVEAYKYVKLYISGQVEDLPEAVQEAIELLEMKEKVALEPEVDRDPELEFITHLMNTRLDKTDLANSNFEEAFGIPFVGEWTYKHTLAIGNLVKELYEFFDREANDGKDPEPVEAPATVGENSTVSSPV